MYAGAGLAAGLIGPFAWCDQVRVANDFTKITVSNMIYISVSLCMYSVVCGSAAASAQWRQRAAAGCLLKAWCFARVMFQQRCQCDCVHVSEAMRMLLRRYNSV